MTPFAWGQLVARLLRGRIDVPASIVARAADVGVELLRGARIEDVRAGPAQLAFRLVTADGSRDVDVLRAGSPVDDETLRAMLELVAPSFAVRRVEVEDDRVVVFVGLRTFGVAVTLDALLHRGRVRSRARSTARETAKAPPSTGWRRAANEPGATTKH